MFVARLLLLSEDHKTAYLADLNEVEPGQFKLNAGKTYKEAVAKLVYPIDVVYVIRMGFTNSGTPRLTFITWLKRSNSFL